MYNDRLFLSLVETMELKYVQSTWLFQAMQRNGSSRINEGDFNLGSISMEESSSRELLEENDHLIEELARWAFCRLHKFCLHILPLL
jgi:hypothetical protein